MLNLLWAPVNVMIHVATHGGFSPAALGLLRWGTLSLLLFGCLAVPKFRTLTRAKWPTRGESIRAILIGICLFGPAHLIYYNALTLTSTIEGAVLGTSAPVWTTLMAFLFLRERVKRQRVAAIAVGFVGAYIVSVGLQLPRLDSGHTGGNLLYLSGVMAESASGVLSAALVRRSSGITILAFQVLGAVIALSMGPLVRPDLIQFTIGTPGPDAWAALAYLVVFPGLICFATWYVIVEKAPLSLMVLTLLLQPPLAAIFGWLVLREPLTPAMGMGTALILVALVLGVFERRRQAPIVA